MRGGYNVLGRSLPLSRAGYQKPKSGPPFKGLTQVMVSVFIYEEGSA
jgi:hypothetical protein